MLGSGILEGKITPYWKGEDILEGGRTCRLRICKLEAKHFRIVRFNGLRFTSGRQIMNSNVSGAITRRQLTSVRTHTHRPDARLLWRRFWLVTFRCYDNNKNKLYSTATVNVITKQYRLTVWTARSILLLADVLQIRVGVEDFQQFLLQINTKECILVPLSNKCSTWTIRCKYSVLR